LSGSDGVGGRAQARSSAIYSASYSLGAAGSFLLAGIFDSTVGWRATFTASGVAPLLAVVVITLLPAGSQRAPARSIFFDFRPVLRDRALMAYVLAFAGNIWEVSAVEPGLWPTLPGHSAFPAITSIYLGWR
jgi:predicted MFS family arabinose efflux permease